MAEIVLSNAHLTVRVDIDRGAEITHIVPAGGENILFHADWRSPLPARTSQTYGSDVLDWLSAYRGGWQELFPNAGAPCTVLGTPLPFHGEVSRAAWSVDWHAEGRDATLSTGTRLPLVLHRRMRLAAEQPILFLEETIENESHLTVPYVWGHHPAFGPPLAAAGARIDLPARRFVAAEDLNGDSVDLAPGSIHHWGSAAAKDGAPVDLSVIPAAPCQRLCFIEEMTAGWAAIRNPAIGLGAGLAWDLADFPVLWLWQEIGNGVGMPWYGRAAITALEPQTQAPAHGLEAAIAAGTARSLAPRGRATARLAVTIFSADHRPVAGIDADGTVTFGASEIGTS